MANTMSDYWALDKNCSQVLVDSMLTSGIRRLGGKANVKEAWEVIFKHFNTKQGNGNEGYTPGEKIAIKINLTNSNGDPGPSRMDASPQLVLSILRHLIEEVGVPQADIWMGDHYRRFRDNYYEKCHSIYPDVHYVDGDGGNGREKTIPSAQQLIQFSDKQETSSIPQHCVDATYFINIPCLKSHDTAGITIAAKNHQGTILEEGDLPQDQSAMYMHYTFPKNNPKTDQYRHMVDYMGHEELGGKTLLYLVDALWAGRSWEGYLEKWTMSPFNNDYPSSLFLSQDAVAIESVCFDFLLTEYADKPESQKYPYMVGVNDYMKQAADPDEWPEGIIYDPEGDGSPITSLGVYEHWNNATDMQYSRNLGTGNGIELVKYFSLATDNYQGESTTDVAQSRTFDYKLFPNPFTENIRIEVRHDQPMSLTIYNMAGQLVFNHTLRDSYTWSGRTKSGSKIGKGTYLVKLTDLQSGTVAISEKIIYQTP